MASGRKRRIWRKSTWRLDECYEGHAVANGVYAAANRIGLNNTCLIRLEFSSGDLRLLQDHKGELVRLTRTRRNPIAEVDLDLQECTSELAFFRTDELTLLILKEQSTNYGYYK
jgi:hypothetical protein